MREGVTPRKRHRTAYMRGYRARQAVERDAAGLLPFQAAFLAAVCRQERPPDIAALSVPRGNGKSWLCGKIVARSLISPGDPLFEAGVENILVSRVPACKRPSCWNLLGRRWAMLTAIAGATMASCILTAGTRVRVISVPTHGGRLGFGANTRLM